MPVDEIKLLRFNFPNKLLICIWRDYLAFVITMLRLIDPMASATLLYTPAIASASFLSADHYPTSRVPMCSQRTFRTSCRHVHVHLCIILILECINFHILKSWIVSAHLDSHLGAVHFDVAVTVLFLPSINVSSV